MLTKVNIIGDKYYHTFTKDGSTNEYYEEECTKEEYEALALPNPVNPVAQQGFTWRYSGCRKKFDTPSGDLEDGQYADYLMRIAKPVGKHIVQAEATYINDAGVDEAKIQVKNDESIKIQKPE